MVLNILREIKLKSVTIPFSFISFRYSLIPPSFNGALGSSISPIKSAPKNVLTVDVSKFPIKVKDTPANTMKVMATIYINAVLEFLAE